MTAELASSPLRRSAGWTGRASQHRRLQVASAASDASTDPTTGSATGPTSRPTSLPPADAVRCLLGQWAAVVEVLDAVPGRAGAVLCTAEGSPVTTHNLSSSDQLRLLREARRLVPSRQEAAGVSGDVVTTVEVAGASCTVTALIPGGAYGDHLLLVTATGVSAPLLHAWTARSAEDLRAPLELPAS